MRRYEIGLISLCMIFSLFFLFHVAMSKKKQPQYEKEALQERQSHEEEVFEEKKIDHLFQSYAEYLEKDPMLFEKACPLKKEIASRDPHNFLGMQRQLAYLEFEKLAAADLEDSQTVIKPLVKYIEEYGKKDKSNLWLIYMTLSDYLHAKKEDTLALIYARSAYKYAPKSMRKQLEQNIQALKKKKNLSKE